MLSKLDLFSYRKVLSFISIAFIVFGFIVYLVKGIKYGIDFVGGVQVHLQVNKDGDKLGRYLKNVDIVKSKDSNINYLIKLKTLVDKSLGINKYYKIKSNTKDNKLLLKNIYNDIFKFKLNKLGSYKFKATNLKKIDENITISLKTNYFDTFDTSTYYSKIKDLSNYLYGIRMYYKNNTLSFKTNVDDIYIISNIYSKLDKKGVKYNVLSKFKYSSSFGNSIKFRFIAIGLIVVVIIILYLSVRFTFWFSISAVVTLFHDCLFIISFVVLAGLEFDTSIIISILTILGYSLNDTIVLFDRIRENIGRGGYNSGNLTDILINKSIVQSLTRTIRTSVTTFVSILCLFIFGGNYFYNLSLTLMVGILVGTYSSIFIASSVLYYNAILVNYTKR